MNIVITLKLNYGFILNSEVKNCILFLDVCVIYFTVDHKHITYYIILLY